MRHTLVLFFSALLAAAQAGPGSESGTRSEASSHDSGSELDSHERRSSSDGLDNAESVTLDAVLWAKAAVAPIDEEFSGEEDSIEDAPRDPLMEALLTAVYSGDTDKIKEMVSAHQTKLPGLFCALEICCTLGFLVPLAAILGQLPPPYLANVCLDADLLGFAMRKKNGTYEILRPFLTVARADENRWAPEGNAMALQASTSLTRRLIDPDLTQALVEEAAAHGHTDVLEHLLSLRPAIVKEVFFKTAMLNSLLLGKRGPIMLVFDRMAWDLEALKEMLFCARMGGVIDVKMGSMAWGRFLQTSPEAVHLIGGMSRIHDKRAGAACGLAYLTEALTRFLSEQDGGRCRESGLSRVILVYLLIFGARHAYGLVIPKEIVPAIVAHCW